MWPWWCLFSTIFTATCYLTSTISQDVIIFIAYLFGQLMAEQRYEQLKTTWSNDCLRWLNVFTQPRRWWRWRMCRWMEFEWWADGRTGYLLSVNCLVNSKKLTIVHGFSCPLRAGASSISKDCVVGISSPPSHFEPKFWMLGKKTNLVPAKSQTTKVKLHLQCSFVCQTIQLWVSLHALEQIFGSSWTLLYQMRFARPDVWWSSQCLSRLFIRSLTLMYA